MIQPLFSRTSCPVMTPTPPPWQPQEQFPNNSLKLITPIICTSTTVNYFQLTKLFSRIWTYSLLYLKHHLLCYQPSHWLLAIPCTQLRHHLLLGLNFSSTVTRCLFIKPASIYQKPTNGDINKYVALGKLFNLSKPKFPNQEEVTITTFKSYTVNTLFLMGLSITFEWINKLPLNCFTLSIWLYFITSNRYNFSFKE